MRLIDADELMNTLQNFFDKREKDQIFSGDRDANVSWNDAICFIKAAPTIDAVPVVRCEDCVPIICPLNGRHKSDNCHCSLRDLERELYNLMKEKLGAKPVD